jgi:hypothetical protein
MRTFWRIVLRRIRMNSYTRRQIYLKLIRKNHN